MATEVSVDSLPGGADAGAGGDAGGDAGVSTVTRVVPEDGEKENELVDRGLLAKVAALLTSPRRITTCSRRTVAC